MSCMYTAQGEFICSQKNQLEHFAVKQETKPKTVNCHGINTTDPCNTCADVEKVYKKANKPFDRTKVDKCFVDCYGVKWPKCNTCDDVKAAYKSKNWKFDPAKVDKCFVDCYGIKTGDACKTCGDVKNVYVKANKLKDFDASKISVCKTPFDNLIKKTDICKEMVLSKDGTMSGYCRRNIDISTCKNNNFIIDSKGNINC